MYSHLSYLRCLAAGKCMWNPPTSSVMIVDLDCFPIHFGHVLYPRRIGLGAKSTRSTPLLTWAATLQTSHLSRIRRSFHGVVFCSFGGGWLKLTPIGQSVQGPSLADPIPAR
jgi:hypothetical protein